MADIDLDRAEFLAALPPIMSAIRTGGDGMRVQFDIPAVSYTHLTLPTTPYV